MNRPIDTRPATEVWKYFDQAFDETDFPSVSWALGSDWGVGTPSPRDNAHYREMAEEKMTNMYGSR
tara:strand:- start:564 stop:761 length:198 start_codon:yes stop_codon:yes gene_type:complete